MNLGSKLSDFWRRFQGELFPALSEEVGPLLETHRRFVAALDLVGVEGFVGAPGSGFGSSSGGPPRPGAGVSRQGLVGPFDDPAPDRQAQGGPGVASAVPAGRVLGLSRAKATFSRAFAQFAGTGLAQRMHEALVVDVLGEALIGHVSRDSTAIESREAAAAKPKTETPKRRPGRPRKGEERPKALSRLERQANGMSLEAMLDDLPKACDRGTKRNARGVLETWRGYKLHIDTADCGVPLSAILTSASVHDSQAAIPLATMTAGRVVNLYDLMDAAYDAREIHAISERLGHVPIIDTNPRRDKALKEARNREARARRAAGHVEARTVRYRIRTVVERTNARLKDEFGARHVRVRGPTKVACHLMFGLLAPDCRSGDAPRRSIGPSAPVMSILCCAPEGVRPANARLESACRPAVVPNRSCRVAPNPPQPQNRLQNFNCYLSDRQFCKSLSL